VQGPKAEGVVQALGLFTEIPAKPLASLKISDATLGEIYLANHARLAGSAGILPAGSGNESTATRRQDAGAPGIGGFDLFVPNSSLGAVADKLIAAAKQIGGRACGWQAFETARIEAGIPRFGVDMDETNLPLECGPAMQDRAVVYNKGCYIGQEVINRIHSFGHVARELRGLRLADDLKSLPQKHDKLFRDGKEVGYVTSAVKSPVFGALVSPKLQCGGANIALGYVRREVNQIGNELVLRTAAGESSAKIVELPFA
jgi:folate-binding protein YgfZ